jgi:hypothetical protein
MLLAAGMQPRKMREPKEQPYAAPPLLTASCCHLAGRQVTFSLRLVHFYLVKIESRSCRLVSMRSAHTIKIKPVDKSNVRLISIVWLNWLLNKPASSLWTMI